MRSRLRMSTRAALAAATAACALAAPVHAGSSGATAGSTTNLLRQNGEGDTITSGDFVSEPNGGLGTFYSYFIEVPPALPSLVVEVFDADVGRAGNNEGDRDFRGQQTFNTTVTYTLRNPAGTLVATVSCTNAAAPAVCVDNAWSPLFGTIASPAAGHWELRVDIAPSDDTNGYGVRAHDGNAGAGGVELPVYAQSYVALGPVNASPQTNTLYPYVTSGCQVRASDFDTDNAGASYGFAGNSGFAQSVTAVSPNQVWLSRLLNRSTTDAAANNYGPWTLTTSIARHGQPQSGTPPNVATLLVGQFDMAAVPTAQPQALSYRIYFGADGGGAPALPRIEQLMGYKMGPQPPVPGQVTTVTITLRITNPSTRTITFSAANTVTTRVPGAGATYGGVAQTTHGTIVSQPAVGGTGSVVWNPGALAPGAVARLAYDVRVLPTAAAQRVVITGTPTANGTTARFVDGTGNTTQARATMTLGPLCENAVTAGVATLAVLSDVSAARTPRGLEVRARSTSELGTLGYRVERFDAAAGAWVAMHDGILPADPPRPAGRLLRVLDPAADDGAPVVLVRVIETDSSGELVHGPWNVAVAERGPHDVDDADDADDALDVGDAASRAGAPGLGHGRHASGARAEIAVTTGGVQRVALADIAAALQTPLGAAAADLAHGRLLLSRAGAAVPVTIVGGDLVFWAPGPARDGEDAYDPRDVHELVRVPGARAPLMAVGPEPARGKGALADSAVTVEHAEQDLTLVTVVPVPAGSDPWLWRALVTGYAPLETATLAIPVAAHTGGDGIVGVRVLGATATGHELSVRVEGADLGVRAFSGVGFVDLSVAVPASALARAAADGVVQVELRARVPAGQSATSAMYVDELTLAHRAPVAPGRTYLGDAAAITLRAPSGVDPVALDVTDVRAPIRLPIANGAVTLPAGARAALADAGSAQRPAIVGEDAPAPGDVLGASDLDVVVIAPSALVDAAQALVEVHAARGLASAVVDVEDVWDAWGHGRRSAHVLRAFLMDAARAGVRFAVLAGAGSLDERGVQGAADALLPVPVRSTPYGLVSADGLYADPDGDGVPDLAVGRLPVLSADALRAYAGVEASAGAPERLLVANDNDEPHAPFAATALDVAELSPLDTARVDLGALGTAAARARLAAELRAGADVTLYVGHGGIDRLASEGLLTSSDVPTLAPARPTVLLGLTCIVNRFEWPGYSSLGERLVEAGAARAVLAPAHAAVHHASEAFGRELVASVGTSATLGEAFVAAARAQPDGAEPFVLLGDPTLPTGATQAAGCASTPASPAQVSWFVFLAAISLSWGRRRS